MSKQNKGLSETTEIVFCWKITSDPEPRPTA